jgi:hypothetical protein
LSFFSLRSWVKKVRKVGHRSDRTIGAVRIMSANVVRMIISFCRITDLQNVRWINGRNLTFQLFSISISISISIFDETNQQLWMFDNLDPPNKLFLFLLQFSSWWTLSWSRKCYHSYIFRFEFHFKTLFSILWLEMQIYWGG